MGEILMSPRIVFATLAVFGLFAACDGKTNNKAPSLSPDGGLAQDGSDSISQSVLGVDLFPPSSLLEPELNMPWVEDFPIALKPPR
jgi:hypothetical protein